MSQVRFGKCDYHGVADIPSTNVGDNIVLWENGRLFHRTVETIGPKTPITTITSADLFTAVKAMQDINVPIIYVVETKVPDIFSVVGQYK